MKTAVAYLDLVEASDRREVEIWIATIWAAELMRRELGARLPEISALHLVPADAGGGCGLPGGSKGRA